MPHADPVEGRAWRGLWFLHLDGDSVRERGRAMSDKKAELHESLHVILGTTGLRTGDIHVSPKVLQMLFAAIAEADVAVKMFQHANKRGR